MATALAPLVDYEFEAGAVAAATESSLYCGPVLVRPKQRYLIQAVPYHDTIFRLNAPLEVSLYPDDGLWICECEPISSSVHAETLTGALTAFCEDFAVLWDEIARASDDSLAPDAQQLKGTLRSLVKAVEKAR